MVMRVYFKLDGLEISRNLCRFLIQDLAGLHGSIHLERQGKRG